MSKIKTVKEKIIKDTFIYTIVQYGSSIFGFIGATAMRSFLGPYLIGIWSLLRVIIEYTLWGELGVATATTFKIPFFKGKGDHGKAKQIEDVAFSFVFIMSVVSGLLILIGTFMLKDKLPAELFAGLVFISAYLCLERLYGYYLIILRAHSNFTVINKSVVFDSLVNLIFIFLLVKNFKMQGLYLTVTILACLNILFIHFLARHRVSFTLKLNGEMAHLLKYGLPLLFVGMLNMILRSTDRIMIAKMLGVTYVGYYSIALLSKNYVSGLSNNFGIVTIPKILEAYGKEENIEHIKKFVTISAEVISYILPCFLGMLYLLIPIFVQTFLPKFIPGILAAQVLLLEIFFSSFCPQASQFITALGKQSRMIPINIGAIIINILANYFFIKIGWGIAGVAVGTFMATLFSSFLILGYAMKHFTGHKEIIKFAIRCILPLIYIIVVVFGCTYFIRPVNVYAGLAIQVAVLIICCVPLLIYINKRTRILSTIFNILFKRVKRK
ncbi:MAG: polysaccharide biosynthesis C-terminal domain-containing protein [Candidatus Omnitrophica bacterium]|nr:polysaccharide biosynthesis C-terminal domain-containing protein [Candidatus Omnitrophota bacterium]